LDDKSNKSPLRDSFYLLNLGLGILVSLLFIILGVSVLMGWLMAPSEKDITLQIFAGLMLIYGIYRALRVYFFYKRIKQYENH
jgi:sulfite exporter TauE/SafE